MSEFLMLFYVEVGRQLCVPMRFQTAIILQAYFLHFSLIFALGVAKGYEMSFGLFAWCCVHGNLSRYSKSHFVCFCYK